LRIAGDLLRWAFILTCGIAYIFIAYLASLDYRSTQGVALPSGLWAWSTSVIRHVVLVPGLLPLIAVIVWALRVRSWRTFTIGAAIVLVMLVYHYVLFAVSAHSDSAYPWFQIGEVVLLWFALRMLLRTSGA
jgi:hypothetical protein